jgi:hypothetical protein
MTYFDPPVRGAFKCLGLDPGKAVLAAGLIVVHFDDEPARSMSPVLTAHASRLSWSNEFSIRR